MPRKKAEAKENSAIKNNVPEEQSEVKKEINEDNLNIPEEKTNTKKEKIIQNDEAKDPETVKEAKKADLGILKVKMDEDEQEDDEAITLWNELVAFYRSKRILTVIVTGIERTRLTGKVVVTYYKNQRILVPLTEMMINVSEERSEGYTLSEILERVCNTMLGAEIDVIIKGMDKQTGSIVASRQEAMLRKRKKFYLTPTLDGLPQVRAGRIVECRIVGVTQLVARLEVFGLETTLGASELSWDWLPNVSDKFHVGDRINALIKEVKGKTVDDLWISVDVKSITANVSKENLNKCAVQNRYIGEITNVRNGVAYLRLKIGVNAIAHTNYDRHMPCKGDIVSFVITRINPEYANVSGIITKIIKHSI